MSLGRFTSDRDLARFRTRIKGKIERKQEVIARFDMWPKRQEFTAGTRK